MSVTNHSAEYAIAIPPYGLRLTELRAVLGDVASLVMETIDTHIQCLFTQVLQLDPKTLRLEAL
ncbi:MAG: hypothetical protein ACXWVX_08625 [Sulfuricurvum sp.]